MSNGKSKYNCHKHPATLQEKKRVFGDSEFVAIRGKRGLRGLPCSWDDINKQRDQKSWKYLTKDRRQYGEGIRQSSLRDEFWSEGEGAFEHSFEGFCDSEFLNGGCDETGTWMFASYYSS